MFCTACSIRACASPTTKAEVMTTALPDAAPDATAAVPLPEQTPFRRFASQFLSSKIAVAGLVLLVAIVLIALFAPWLAPQNPYDLATLDVMDRVWRPARRAPTA